jgi:hypothetical protein
MASTQEPPKPVDSPGIFSANTPRQRPVSIQRHSGTPHDPIYLCDDEERQTTTPSSSKLKQALIRKSEPPTMAVAGPSNPTSQSARPPYLKARSLPERKSAGPLPRPLEEALDSLKAEIQAGMYLNAPLK